MYSIDNNILANEKSILSNTDDRDHYKQFYQRERFSSFDCVVFQISHHFLLGFVF